MTTIVNTPPSSEARSSGLGFVLGIIVLLLAIYLFFVYALPAFRGTGTNIAVPDRIDVNVNPPAE